MNNDFMYNLTSLVSLSDKYDMVRTGDTFDCIHDCDICSEIT